MPPHLFIGRVFSWLIGVTPSLDPPISTTRRNAAARSDGLVLPMTGLAGEALGSDARPFLLALGRVFPAERKSAIPAMSGSLCLRISTGTCLRQRFRVDTLSRASASGNSFMHRAPHGMIFG